MRESAGDAGKRALKKKKKMKKKKRKEKKERNPKQSERKVSWEPIARSLGSHSRPCGPKPARRVQLGAPVRIGFHLSRFHSIISEQCVKFSVPFEGGQTTGAYQITRSFTLGKRVRRYTSGLCKSSCFHVLPCSSRLKTCSVTMLRETIGYLRSIDGINSYERCGMFPPITEGIQAWLEITKIV